MVLSAMWVPSLCKNTDFAVVCQTKMSNVCDIQIDLVDVEFSRYAPPHIYTFVAVVILEKKAQELYHGQKRKVINTFLGKQRVKGRSCAELGKLHLCRPHDKKEN